MLIVGFSESLCLLVFLSMQRHYKRKAPCAMEEIKYPKVKFFFCAVPALFDFISTVCFIFAEVELPEECALFFQVFLYVPINLLTRFYLNHIQPTFHFFACVLLIVGPGIVGIMTFKDTNLHPSFLACVLTILGNLIRACAFISEQKMFIIYPNMHPLHLIGYEGLWNILFSSAILFALSYVPCQSSLTICKGGYIVNL